jgi:hypothetical protein
MSTLNKAADNDGVAGYAGQTVVPVKSLANQKASCYVDLPPIGFGIIILTRDIAFNDVDDGGLVTTEEYSHSSYTTSLSYS